MGANAQHLKIQAGENVKSPWGRLILPAASLQKCFLSLHFFTLPLSPLSCRSPGTRWHPISLPYRSTRWVLGCSTLIPFAERCHALHVPSCPSRCILPKAGLGLSTFSICIQCRDLTPVELFRLRKTEILLIEVLSRPVRQKYIHVEAKWSMGQRVTQRSDKINPNSRQSWCQRIWTVLGLLFLSLHWWCQDNNGNTGRTERDHCSSWGMREVGAHSMLLYSFILGHDHKMERINKEDVYLHNACTSRIQAFCCEKQQQNTLTGAKCMACSWQEIRCWATLLVSECSSRPHSHTSISGVSSPGIRGLKHFSPGL